MAWHHISEMTAVGGISSGINNGVSEEINP